MEQPQVGSESQVAKGGPEAGVDEKPRAADNLMPTEMKQSKDEQLMAIEKIMEDNLKSVFASLPESKRIRFKQAGEKLAADLAREIKKPSINPRRILAREKHWLSLIPHVNRYFRLQEAACKTSRIVTMHEELKEQREMGI